jgi:antirestriction protein ArdC
MKRDIYTEVTAKLIAKLEQGVPAWRKSWNAVSISGLPTRASGDAYKGVNVLILACEGRGNRHWMTYKQAAEHGGNVRKGEKSTTIVFYKKLTVEDRAKSDGSTKIIPMLRAYNVFNAEQIDGLPTHFYAEGKPLVSDNERDAAVEAYVANTGAAINHGGNRAFYAHGFDSIQMPPLAAFDDSAAYYGTLLHELTHWTGHADREDRTFGKRFGDDAYAFEELVAEIGATFVCAALGIEQEVRDDHAAYLAGWLKILKADNKAIFQAAAKAQAAADFLDGLQIQEAQALAA